MKRTTSNMLWRVSRTLPILRRPCGFIAPASGGIAVAAGFGFGGQLCLAGRLGRLAEVPVFVEELVPEPRDDVTDDPEEKPQAHDADARKLIKDGDKMLHGGTISLQSESHPVEFRKVELRKLED